jgi:hypothetical protein
MLSRDLVYWLPAVGQQLIEPTGRLGWQALQHVAEVPIGFVTAEFAD